MNVAELKKFASDACTVIDAYGELVAELVAENKKLAAMPKEASAKPMELGKEALNKAASAVHMVYGSRSNVTPEQIEEAWKSNPDYMLGVINKFASELLNRQQTSGAELGTVMEKSASAVVEGSADDAFRNKYITR